MRAILGVLILGGLFLAAASWQESQTASLRAKRRSEHGIDHDSPTRRGDGRWSTLVLGAPSGAEPLLQPGWTADHSPDPTASAGSGATEGEPLNEGEVTPDFSYTVRSGDILGRICRDYYGSGGASLVEAVARYNGLSSPDSIRAGKPILLPDRSLLEE